MRLFVRKYDVRTRPIGKGLVELVPDWRAHMDWSDLVILEANGFSMLEFARWKERGVLIIGGTPESAAWELDRKQGMAVFKKAGIAVPPYREFNDYPEAMRYVERRGEPLYSKPCSDTADKSLSAKTGVPEDPTYMLRKWQKKHGRPSCPFLLQDGVDGVEFAVGAWFGPAGFAQGFEENFEHKRFCAGDIGPNTGEMGTVLRYVSRSKLASQVLTPLEEFLDRISYTGNVDVNCIVDEAGNAWPLEFTMRLGWPAFNIELDLFDCDPIEFLHALASGETVRGAHKMNEVAVGVVMAIPPYPHPPRDYEEVVGVPLYGLETIPGWHPCEVQAGEETMCSAGTYIGIAVGTGNTVREAHKRSGRILSQASVPTSPFWRNDIGARLKKDLPSLQAHGFATGMEF